MEHSEIVNKITPVFRTVLKDDTIVLSDEMSSSDFEKWDSLSQMLLASEIEKLFSIKFKIREVSSFKTVGDLIGIIESKLN